MKKSTEESSKKTKEEFEPRILAILCTWCSYAGADLAGVSRMQYPPNVRVVKVPCSARVNPLYILRALQEGWDGILVSGCHPGDCHYIAGNYAARRRFSVFRNFMEYIGVEPERVNFSWVSASEGAKYAEVMKTVIDKIKQIGPAERLVKEYY
ncbi:MAG: hydrogenase iron-sulfur subunit [bacterium]|nr:hydrogenase iron-sulfur subunit [bacterium]